MGTLFVGEDTILSILFLGSSFSGFTIIAAFELLVYELEFLDKVEL